MLDRWLHTQAVVHTPYETAARVLGGHTYGVLRRALGLPAGEPSGTGAFTLRDTLVCNAHVEQVVLRAHATVAQHDTTLVRVLFGWNPGSTPGTHSDLDGELALTPEGPGSCVLSLNAVYRVPPATHRPAAIVAATQGLARRVVREIAAALESGSAVGGARFAPLRVRDLMTCDPIVLHTDQSVIAAALVLLHHRIGGAPVIDEAGRLVGVFSESDMLAREAAAGATGGWRGRDEERRRDARTVGDACSRPAIKIGPDSTVREAARRLLDRDVGRLVVVDGDRVVGVLSRHDVLRALTRTAEELQHAVERALARLDLPGISATVDAGYRVRLTGVAPNLDAAGAAVRVAAAVDGITGVDDDISVSSRHERALR